MDECKNHRTIILSEGRKAELMCECGRIVRGKYKGGVFVEEGESNEV